MIVKPAHDQPLAEVDSVIKSMLSDAKEWVQFSTGLTSGGLGRLRADFEECLKRISSFQLLLDNSVDEASFRTGYDWVFDHASAQVKVSPIPILHWLIVDGRNLRLEEPHARQPPGVTVVTPDTPRSNTLILDCDRSIARLYLDAFNVMWSNGRTLHRASSPGTHSTARDG